MSLQKWATGPNAGKLVRIGTTSALGIHGGKLANDCLCSLCVAPNAFTLCPCFSDGLPGSGSWHWVSSSIRSTAIPLQRIDVPGGPGPYVFIYTGVMAGIARLQTWAWPNQTCSGSPSTSTDYSIYVTACVHHADISLAHQDCEIVCLAMFYYNNVSGVFFVLWHSDPTGGPWKGGDTIEPQYYTQCWDMASISSCCTDEIPPPAPYAVPTWWMFSTDLTFTVNFGACP